MDSTQAAAAPSQPKVIRLADYTPPPYRILSVALEFDLAPHATRVTSTLKIEAAHDRAAGLKPLELDGEGLKTISILIDGQPPKGDTYALTDQGLQIHQPPASFTLETEVEIDPATGEVAIVAYASVNDIGRVVSPTIVQGQIEGGAVQGIGQALCERVAYDAETGQLQSASFMDYALPHADGFIGFKTKFDTSVPCKTNVLGVKGVGELGTIGATPTVVNAIVDALDSAGLGAAGEALQMPVTAERIWRALNLKQFDASPYKL